MSPPFNIKRSSTKYTPCPVTYKQTYDKKKQALNAISHSLKIKKMQMYPYKCPHCRGWHITKQEQKESLNDN